MTLVSKHIPTQTQQDKHRALQTASKHLLSKGVTTVCDMGSVQDADDAWDTMQNVYMPAAHDGELTVRIMAMVPLPTWYGSTAGV